MKKEMNLHETKSEVLGILSMLTGTEVSYNKPERQDLLGKKTIEPES